MKKILFFLFVLLVPEVGFSQTMPAQEVQEAEYAWLRAYEQNDTLAMDRYVADGFLIRYPDGSADTKDKLMQRVRQHAGKASSLRLSTEQTTAHVWGNTVILRGIVTSEFEAAGKKHLAKQYYTDTWLKTEEGWQVIASHLSNLPESAPSANKATNKSKKKKRVQ